METLVFGYFVSTSPWSFWSASDRPQATTEGEDAQPQPAHLPKARQSAPAPATVAASETQPTDDPILVVLPLF